MIDLSTNFMGLTLRNPIIIGSSELTNSAERVKILADHGAGAVVLKSLFEEQIIMDIDAERVNNMANSYDYTENYIGYYLKKNSVDSYLKLISNSKKLVDIPVIASINCVSADQWIDFAVKMQEAGADALEVNMFIMPANANLTGAQIEKIYFDLASKITNAISIPVAFKVSSYFSGMANFFVNLSHTPIKGLVFFNKFYSPAINIETETLTNQPIFSQATDHGQSLRWIGILSDQLECDLVSSTGVYGGNELISSLLVGAKAVQMVSSVYNNGDKVINESLEELSHWMRSKNYKNLNDFRGKLSGKNQKNPMMFERAQFMKYFSDSGR